MGRLSASVGSCSLALACLVASPGAHAALETFESFTDGDTLVNEVAGVTLSGGTVATAGVSLNEISYPPHSGSNVLAALSNVLSLEFSGPTSASAYFVTLSAITAQAYDASNNLLQTLVSSFGSTLGTPTAFDFSVAGAYRYVLSTNVAFVIDDLAFTTTPTTVPTGVPEPASWAATAAALLALAAASRRRSAAALPARPAR